jgi:hypothetical protein
MQHVFQFLVPYMNQVSALSTQQTFALRLVCRAGRDAVDENVSSLVRVELQNKGIDDGGAERMAACLAGCSMLTHVVLGCNSIRGRGAGFLGLLQTCAELVHVNLEGNLLGDDGTAAVVAALRQCKALATLELTANQVTQKGATALADGLQHWPRLRTLRLGENELGDAGVQTLVGSLSKCEMLASVNLSDNKIGNAGAHALFDLLVHCRMMQELRIGGNAFDSDTLDDLFTRLFFMYAAGPAVSTRPAFLFSA